MSTMSSPGGPFVLKGEGEIALGGSTMSASSIGYVIERADHGRRARSAMWPGTVDDAGDRVGNVGPPGTDRPNPRLPLEGSAPLRRRSPVR